MANRRMFSKDVVDTDKFLEMPPSTQALYFHLGMRADDDGFVSSPKKITQFVNCGNDDLKLLLAKGYLIPFESGVVVISDWNVNNWIRADRKHATRFEQEKSLLRFLLSCCIANEILKKRDISVKFISVSEYIELTKSGNSDNVRERINSILDAGLLIFDEIGAIEESRDWISNTIFRLVDYRYTHILPTIYTSNIEIDKLKCDERAKDRIFELSYKIHMPEESIRRLRAEKRRSKFIEQII